MAEFRPSNPETILPLVVKKILADAVFGDGSLVRLSDDPEEDKPYYPPFNQYMTVTAGGAVRADPWEGAVRAFLHINQELICVVWTRWGVDVAGRAEHMLTDPQGVLAKVTQVINSLHGYQVSDEDGNLYSTQPIVYDREDRATRQRNNEEWSRRRVYLSLFYQRDTPLPAVTPRAG